MRASNCGYLKNVFGARLFFESRCWHFRPLPGRVTGQRVSRRGIVLRPSGPSAMQAVDNRGNNEIDRGSNQAMRAALRYAVSDPTASRTQS